MRRVGESWNEEKVVRTSGKDQCSQNHHSPLRYFLSEKNPMFFQRLPFFLRWVFFFFRFCLFSFCLFVCFSLVSYFQNLKFEKTQWTSLGFSGIFLQRSFLGHHFFFPPLPFCFSPSETIGDINVGGGRTPPPGAGCGLLEKMPPN